MSIEQYCQSVDHRPRKATYRLHLEKEITTYMCDSCFEQKKAEYKNRIATRMQSRQQREIQEVL